MALHPDFPESPHEIIDPSVHWLPVHKIREEVVFHDVAFIEVKPHIHYPPDKGGKGGYIPYNKNLTEKVRESRKNPTPAEQKMWFEVLQNKRLENLKFTRQKPLAECIVDFYCSELMLVIEIDGDTHAGQIQYDKHRTGHLNKYGVEVIRHTNAEVLNNIDGVYKDLRKRISARNPPKSPLSGGLPTVAVELTSVAHECEPGRRKLAVKVVDIFGNDTMTIVEALV